MSNSVKDEVGTRKLFENEQVRVWDLQLQPGENLGVHRHENDYVLIFVGDSTIRGTNADGSTRFQNDMSDGDVLYRKIDGKEDIHDAYNAGTTPSRNFIIELKK